MEALAVCLGPFFCGGLWSNGFTRWVLSISLATWFSEGFLPHSFRFRPFSCLAFTAPLPDHNQLGKPLSFSPALSYDGSIRPSTVGRPCPIDCVLRSPLLFDFPPEPSCIRFPLLEASFAYTRLWAAGWRPDNLPHCFWLERCRLLHATHAQPPHICPRAAPTHPVAL